jgi:guanylate cyclase
MFDLNLDIKYLIVDHLNRSGNVELTYMLLIGTDRQVNGTAIPQNDSTYIISIKAQYLGSQVLAIFLQGKQLPNSPFLVIVQKGICQNSSGRVMDMNGNCVCPPGVAFQLWESCVMYQTFVPAVTIPILSCLCVVLLVFIRRVVARSRASDNFWLIHEAEIMYSEPIEVLGRGSRCEVVLAKYRGTSVAVKLFKCSISHTKSILTSESSGIWSRLAANGKHSLGTISSSLISSATQTTIPTSTSLNGSTGAMITHKVIPDFDKLRNDVKNLARLRHPCLTTVIGAVIMGNGHFTEIRIVMELTEFGSLWDLLHNDMYPIRSREALRFLQDVSKGMHFLHDEIPPCVHGDLKSSNILIDRNFSAKISDFCLHFNISLSYWAAPECFVCKTASVMADVYSFGVVVYEVLTRKVPYEGENMELVYEQLVHGTQVLVAPQGSSAEISVLMNECLNHSPTNRPPFSELSRRLHALDVSQMISTAFAPEEQLQSSEILGHQSMQIMRNLFPPHIADALMRGEKVPPERQDMVTMYFSDIVGFTTIASKLTPEQVSDLLDRFFSRLDTLAESMGIYKIETIGDAYLCATNVLRMEAATHAVVMAQFAVATQLAASETLVDLNDTMKGHVNIRVGLSSGPCMASVVGQRNPKYTLFGDTINIASRMESSSHPGYIQCSKRTADLVRQQDVGKEIRLVRRGFVVVKGKGEMETFWILLPGQEPPDEGRQ